MASVTSASIAAVAPSVQSAGQLPATSSNTSNEQKTPLSKETEAKLDQPLQPVVRPFIIDWQREKPFYTGVDLSAPEEQEKKKQRALKFGIQPSQPEPVEESSQMDSEELERRKQRAVKFGIENPTEPMEIVFGSSEITEEEKVQGGADAKRRWEVVHVFGSRLLADLMSTQDVLNYFSDYSPVCVEWIFETNCNVVFGDAASAKRAMMALSRTPLKETEVKLSPEQLQAMGGTPDDVQFISPRLCKDSTSRATMLLRTATDRDVKGKFKKGHYYQIVGYPNRPRAPKPPPPVKKLSLADIRAKRAAEKKAAEEQSAGEALKQEPGSGASDGPVKSEGSGEFNDNSNGNADSSPTKEENGAAPEGGPNRRLKVTRAVRQSTPYDRPESQAAAATEPVQEEEPSSIDPLAIVGEFSGIMDPLASFNGGPILLQPKSGHGGAKT